MTDDPLCKRDGCKHPLSVHNISRAEKHAMIEGIMLSDFPSGQRDEFNIQSGTADSSCSEDGCDCYAFLSPNA